MNDPIMDFGSIRQHSANSTDSATVTSNYYKTLDEYWCKIDLETRQALQMLKDDFQRYGMSFNGKFQTDFVKNTCDRIMQTCFDFALQQNVGIKSAQTPTIQNPIDETATATNEETGMVDSQPMDESIMDGNDIPGDELMGHFASTGVVTEFRPFTGEDVQLSADVTSNQTDHPKFICVIHNKIFSNRKQFLSHMSSPAHKLKRKNQKPRGTYFEPRKHAQRLKSQLPCHFNGGNDDNSNEDRYIEREVQPSTGDTVSNTPSKVEIQASKDGVGNAASKVESVEAMETEVESVAAADFNEIDSHFTATRSNSAAELLLVSIEETLFIQISAQCIKMKNRTIANTDKTSIKSIGLRSAETGRNRSVRYCKMEANGNCFFLSIAHQLFDVKIGSKQHQEQAQQLRESVVAYIKMPENFPNFLHYLKNRIEYSRKANDSEIKEMCDDFLNQLSEPGTWAGTESIRAISEMENVNVAVINDDGNAYIPCHFNAQAAHTILLLFGTLKGRSKNNSERSHYDSVTTLHPDQILRISSKIANDETNHVQFVKEAENRCIISIE